MSDRPNAAINAPVFAGSLLLILAFVAFGAVFPDRAAATFGAVQDWITDSLGWFYLMTVTGFLLFVLYLALSRFGQVRLGPDHAEPDYAYASWFAMLFSAGMGIGLVFFGVSEPVTHFLLPPEAEPRSVAAAQAAMRLTFFHWGLHAWSVYAVVGLSLAYFSFRRGLPLTIRSALHPLIGERIHGPIGHAVDTFAVLGTMFGVATSLGLGALQINAGLAHVFGVPVGVGTQVAIIAVVTLMATASAVSGVDAGIRRLSELNLLLALLLMLFVFAVGPTTFLLRAYVQNIGAYADDLLRRSFNMYAYDPRSWLKSWTLFYWGWWIAWSPFVGMFIARISRGRTIREFVLSVLFVPAGFTFAWMTVFGGTGIFLDLRGVTAAVSETVRADVALGLFALLEQFPLSGIASVLAILLIVIFFVTSADSAALVVDTLASGGRTDTPVWQRIFWAVLSGVIGAVLLAAGGLTALQTASIAGALPFAAVMILVCHGLVRGLRQDTLFGGLRAPRMAAGGLWQQRLGAILHQPSEAEVRAFLADAVAPAMEAVAAELHGREVPARVERTETAVRLRAMPDTAEEFRYGVRLRGYDAPSFAWVEMRRRERIWRAEVFLRRGGQDYDVMGLRREDLIADILAQYERHAQYLHALRTA